MRRPSPRARPSAPPSTRTSPPPTRQSLRATRSPSSRPSPAAEAVATIRVHEAPFDAGAEIAALSAGRTDIGGIGCFVGVVRGGDGRDAVAEMTLEHYPAMTVRAIERVLAASAHRQPALEATQFLIDWLKTCAPFWKQERMRDGQARWVEARAEDDE